MRPRFSPQRHGTKYILDDGDVVILGSTPVFNHDYGSLETRIRVGQNGFAERALWVTLPLPVDEAGASTEFHLWTYKVDGKTLAEIGRALDALARIGVRPQAQVGQRFKTLRFWHAGEPVKVSVSQPPDPSLTDEQITLFNLAWEAIESAVPVGP